VLPKELKKTQKIVLLISLNHSISEEMKMNITSEFIALWFLP